MTFHGSVDAPFISMYGAVGVRLLDDSERPGQFVPDPGSLFADGGKNWGSFFVAGSVGGVTQFIARVQDNATFAASMVSPPAGRWSFQLISYATAADALADTNRILIGHPWRETERPGDVRDYDVTAYVKALAALHGRRAARDRRRLRHHRPLGRFRRRPILSATGSS